MKKNYTFAPAKKEKLKFIFYKPQKKLKIYEKKSKKCDYHWC